MDKEYSLTFLGTGTSTGVPQIGCRCETCLSTDPRDRRLRCSALVRTPLGNTFLIDAGPDFREQILHQGSPELTAALLTHTHYDHVGGIDDLRPYCAHAGEGNFEVFCRPDVARDLRNRIPYCFAENPYPGVPVFHLCEIYDDRPFSIHGDPVVPLPVMHAKLPIVGYRFGPLAYITDCKTMPESTFSLLKGVDTLVINALRHEPHYSHLSLTESLAIIGRVRPRVAYLTHLSHQMGPHARVEPTLPPNVFIAVDGSTVTVPVP